MELISGLALVLLTLVGYSSGAVLGARGRMAVPGLLDLLVVVAMWAVALSTRHPLGKWGAIGVWLVIGLGVGALLARVRASRYPSAPLEGPTGEAPPSFPGRLWRGWKRFSRQMGNYQSRALMAFLYFTVVLPFGLVVTLLDDPLTIKQPPSRSNWQPKQMLTKPSLYEAGRQF